MFLAEAAAAINGSLSGENVEFHSVSTDTRTIKSGDLFIALKGPNFNGHDYIAKAVAAGASGLLVSEAVDANVPYIKVENTLRGLGELACAWRDQFDISTIAITGSCGKTTVKEMVASILSLKGETLATQGNLNNEIGVPLTLLSINEGHEFAVIELGANHIGEIAYTVSLVKPSVAVITNAGNAHIEGFGSAENIAKAKGEIYQGLMANGKAVINFDDDFADYWREIAEGYELIGFSLENANAAFFSKNIQLSDSGHYEFDLHAVGEQIKVRLPVLGKHNVLNAVTAATVAMQVGASIEQVKVGLEKVTPIKGRLYPVKVGKHLVVDDTYNANPVSIKAAVEMVAEMDGKTSVVLGDMAELGTHAPSLHREVGEYVALQGVDYLVVKGKHAADYLVGFNKFKDDTQTGMRFDEFHEVVGYLNEEAPEIILVKGSRSAAMENVVEQFCDFPRDQNENEIKKGIN